MKSIEFARLFPRRPYIHVLASALALSAVIMGVGFSGRSATIDREKMLWETPAHPERNRERFHGSIHRTKPAARTGATSLKRHLTC